MENLMLISVCLSTMAALSWMWVDRTLILQDTNRSRRITKHLDWQSSIMGRTAKRRKRGLW